MIWAEQTRAQLLKLAGVDPVRDTKRVMKVYRDATTAKTEEDFPDHAIRISGARGLSAIYGLEAPKQQEAPDATRPVNVAIILTGANGAHAGAALPTHGVVLHLSDHNGDAS